MLFDKELLIAKLILLFNFLNSKKSCNPLAIVILIFFLDKALLSLHYIEQLFS